MAILIDTNVLVRYADQQDPQHSVVRRAITSMRASEPLRITSQNLIEFWNVLTRPINRNGFGKTPSQAAPLLDMTEKLFPRLADPADTYERWRELVVRFRVSGVQVHDARLVTVMRAHNVTRILTFNASDFRRYADVGIRAIDPAGF